MYWDSSRCNQLWWGELEIPKTSASQPALPPSAELLLKFPGAEAFDDIAAGGDQTTTEVLITVALPPNAVIVRAMLLADITIMNDTATAHKINLDVDARPQAGAWANYWTVDTVVGFPAADGATTGMTCIVDISALVNAAANYGFRFTVNQSGGANSVHYTTQYVLVITYEFA